MRIIIFFILIVLSSCNINSDNQKESKQDSIYIEYHRNSNISCKIPYKSGKKQGTAEWFYDNGNIQSTHTYDYDININDSYYYSKSDSGRLDKIVFCNYEGKPIFKILYDSSGSISNMQGTPLYIKYNFFEKGFSINDTLEFEIVSATIPDSYVSIVFGMIGPHKYAHEMGGCT